jgi:hypothetical protein
LSLVVPFSSFPESHCLSDSVAKSVPPPHKGDRAATNKPLHKSDGTKSGTMPYWFRFRCILALDLVSVWVSVVIWVWFRFWFWFRIRIRICFGFGFGFGLCCVVLF